VARLEKMLVQARVKAKQERAAKRTLVQERDAAKRRLALEKARAKQVKREASRERMMFKRIVKTHSAGASDPFRFYFENSGAANTAKSSLVDSATKIANNYMTVPRLHGLLKEFGVTARRMKKVKLIFEDPHNAFKSEKSVSDRYAHSWIFPDQPYTIFADSNLLSRYEAVFGITGPEAEAERTRIEILFAWKLIHEVVHLGFRWLNGPNAVTPEKYGRESGEYVENAVFGGITGFVFASVGNSRWNGSQKVVLLIVSVGRKTFEVDETYLRLVSAESKRDHPVFDTLLPVQMPNPYVQKKGQTRKSSPRRSSRAGVLAVDGMPWPGKNKNWTVCMGKCHCGKMYWDSMQPQKLNF
jgi:hypothetical protein